MLNRIATCNSAPVSLANSATRGSPAQISHTFRPICDVWLAALCSFAHQQAPTRNTGSSNDPPTEPARSPGDALAFAASFCAAPFRFITHSREPQTSGARNSFRFDVLHTNVTDTPTILVKWPTTFLFISVSTGQRATPALRRRPQPQSSLWQPEPGNSIFQPALLPLLTEKSRDRSPAPKAADR